MNRTNNMPDHETEEKNKSDQKKPYPYDFKAFFCIPTHEMHSSKIEVHIHQTYHGMVRLMAFHCIFILFKTTKNRVDDALHFER